MCAPPALGQGLTYGQSQTQGSLRKDSKASLARGSPHERAGAPWEPCSPLGDDMAWRRPPPRRPLICANSVMFKSLICSLIVCAGAALGAGCGGATSTTPPATTTITSATPTPTPTTTATTPAQGQVTPTNPNDKPTTPAKTTTVPSNPGAGGGTSSSPPTPHSQGKGLLGLSKSSGKHSVLRETFKRACERGVSGQSKLSAKAGAQLRKLCEKLR